MNPFTEQIEHEDLMLFINSCFAATSQAEFYTGAAEQWGALNFLHLYICINYRSLYAATLALGINQHNQQRIVLKLLSTRDDSSGSKPVQETALIRTCLRRMPVHRVYKTFYSLAWYRINNRRVRATIRDYLAWRDNLSFDLVKYRRLLRLVMRHNHQSLSPESHEFLYGKGWKKKSYTDPLLENFRQAHFSAEALYRLPYSIAEGLAARQGISREKLLARVQLTDHEKLRLQASAARAKVDIALEPEKTGLTRLLLWMLSLPRDQRRTRLGEFEALIARCRQRFASSWLGFKKLALILDNSFSSSGSRAKKYHPLAIGLGAHYLLGPLADEYKPFWLHPPEHPLLAEARGASGIGARLLDAIEWGAQEIIVISDGAENNPAGATHWLLAQLQDPANAAWAGKLPRMVHFNPVFSPDHYGPGALSPLLPTVGIREAENLPGLWILSLFAARVLSRADLETYLRSAADEYLHHP